MNDENDPLLKIKQICKKHLSEIGGLCDNILCQKNEQMKCVKCISDNNECIRSQKHKFITIKEFVDNFFNVEYKILKTNYNTSKNTNYAESYCRNAELILNTFCSKRDNIYQCFLKNYEDIITYLNELKNNFDEFYKNFMDEKLEQLKDSLVNLDLIINYDSLEGLIEDDLKIKMSKMPFDTLNGTFLKMKKTIDNLKNNKHIEDVKIIENIIGIGDGDFISYLQNDMDNIKNDLEKSFELYKNEMNINLFRDRNIEKFNCSNFKKYYDMPIDYSINSHFLYKKFSIYKSIFDNNIYFAYPTSLNVIKIELFSNIISSNKIIESKKPNDKLFLDTGFNSRNNLLFFKLEGHVGKILDIQYYLLKEKNLEYLISSSEDHTIKIWNISNLIQYQQNPNQYYKDFNVINLIGHTGIINKIQLFYDIKKNKNLIISISKNDKIKVWDFETGKLITDIYDRNSNQKGTYEDLFYVITIDEINYLITINNTTHLIKIWDFDQNLVTEILQYKSNSKIIQFLYQKFQNKIILLDENGTCGILEIIKNKDSILTDMNLYIKDTERNGALLWEENMLYIYNKNGRIDQFDLDQTKFIDKIRICNFGISYMIKFYDEYNDRNLLICHCEDQFLKIFG